MCMFEPQDHGTLNKNNISRLVVGLSLNKISFLRSLRDKKKRDEHGVFVVEGEKIVRETLELHSALIEHVFAIPGVFDEFGRIERISPAELKRISNLSTPNKALAVIRKPQFTSIKEGLTIVLDTIQDPGNLGTIIRLADWFGVSEIICSKETADCFSSKVVQSAMGSILRVDVRYTDLYDWLSNNSKPVYGAVIDGTNIYQEKLHENAVILIGNESKGISPGLLNFLTHTISIPKFGRAESLNASVAAGIILSEFKKRTI